jgi:signal peptidase II
MAVALTLRERSRIVFPLLVVSWAVDAASKRLAVRYLGDGRVHSYLGDLFRLEFSENNGAFLSLGSELPPDARFWLLTVGLGATLLALLVYIFRTSTVSRLGLAGLTLICAGGLCNWIDRLLFGGYVIDFMNLGIGGLRTGIFNIADLLIEAGAIMLLWDMYRSPGRRRE